MKKNIFDKNFQFLEREKKVIDDGLKSFLKPNELRALEIILETHNLDENTIYKIKLLALFVKDNLSYYIPKFIRFLVLNKMYSFNFPAFFFPLLWTVYRRMYLRAVFIFIPVAFLGFVFSFIYSLYANYLYYLFAKKKIKNIVLDYGELNTSVLSKISETGGGSFISILWFIVISFILLYIISYII